MVCAIQRIHTRLPFVGASSSAGPQTSFVAQSSPKPFVTTVFTLGEPDTAFLHPLPPPCCIRSFFTHLLPLFRAHWSLKTLTLCSVSLLAGAYFVYTNFVSLMSIPWFNCLAMGRVLFVMISVHHTSVSQTIDYPHWASRHEGRILLSEISFNYISGVCWVYSCSFILFVFN